MLPVQFIYVENGKPSNSVAENRRRCEIGEHNMKLVKKYSNIFKKADANKEIKTQF